MVSQFIKCGDANPNGNVFAFFKGGCKKMIDKLEAYRCTECGGWFHKECILKHFELEKEHDWGREEERKHIKDIINRELISVEKKYYFEVDKLSDDTGYFDHNFVLKFIKKQFDFLLKEVNTNGKK